MCGHKVITLLIYLLSCFITSLLAFERIITALSAMGYIERLQGVWPKIPVAMGMPIFYVNFSSLNYPNLNNESLGPYG